MQNTIYRFDNSNLIDLWSRTLKYDLSKIWEDEGGGIQFEGWGGGCNDDVSLGAF